MFSVNSAPWPCEEGDLAEAVKSYREALKLFQRLNEPLMEAVAHHQLGRALQEAKQWDEAETHLAPSCGAKSVARSDRWTKWRGNQLDPISDPQRTGWKAGGRGDLVPEGH